MEEFATKVFTLDNNDNDVIYLVGRGKWFDWGIIWWKEKIICLKLLLLKMIKK